MFENEGGNFIYTKVLDVPNSSGKRITYDSTVRRIFPAWYERIKCLQQYT